MRVKAKPYCPYGKQASPQSNVFNLLYGYPDEVAWGAVQGAHLRGLTNFLLLPLGDRPFQYRWRVNGVGILCINGGCCDAMEAEDLIHVLLSEGATYVIDNSPFCARARLFQLERAKAA